MSSWINLHCHSTYSLLDGLSKPKDMAARIVANKQTACAITDHGNVSGVIEFAKCIKEACVCGHQKNSHQTGQCKQKECSCKKYEKGKLKPIFGMEAYLSKQDSTIRNPENRKLSHLVILCKNLDGWKNLIKAVSESNKPENFYYRPRLSLDKLASFSKGQWITFSGHPGSDLANNIFTSLDAYKCKTYEEAKKYVRSDWEESTLVLIKRYQDLFGKENFYLEIQIIDKDNVPASLVVARILRYMGTKHSIKCVATADSHYPTQEDAADQRVLLCNSLETTLNNVYKKMEDEVDIGLGTFFRSNNYHMPSSEEMAGLHTEDELKNSLEIASRCEEYDILAQPELPHFSCPDNLSETDYLKKLCIEGWKKKIEPLVPKSNIPLYQERIREELDVIEQANLSGYFLIVHDYVTYAHEKLKCVKSYGRGCLHPNNKIMIENGEYKKISELSLEDKVYTHNGKPSNISNILKYKIEKEELIYISTYYDDNSPIALTKDHKVLCLNKLTNSIHWKEAGLVTTQDYLYTPIIHRDIINQETIDLSEYQKSCDSLRYDNDYVYHEPKNALCNTIQFSNKISRYIKLDDDWFKIIGLFAGNGWLRSKVDSNIGFAFNSLDTRCLEFVKNKFESIGCKTSVFKHRKKNLNQLLINDKNIVMWFKNMFDEYRSSSATKHVPKLVMQSANNSVASFLQGYYLSDGHLEKKTRVRYTTVSPKLANQVRFLCLSLGIPCKISIEDRRHKLYKTGFKHNSIAYKLTIPCRQEICGCECVGNRYKIAYEGILCKVRKIEKKMADCQDVYDIEVVNDYNYLTSNFIVHNSVAGCLIAYLLGITNTPVDPIKHGLVFSRFFNKGRISPGKVSLPDIDCDFPKDKRDKVFAYIEQKHGTQNVAQMSTFARMQGRSALKDVLRIHEACSFDEMNAMSEYIPDEAEISDDLQEMREEEGDSSIIKWALENNAEKLRKWCFINDNHELDGPMARYFAQAIRLEGTKRSQGKHAAGIIISNRNLHECCPMLLDKKTGHLITSWDMHAMEAAGHVKFDVLGVAALSKIGGVINLLAGRKVDDDG